MADFSQYDSFTGGGLLGDVVPSGAAPVEAGGMISDGPVTNKPMFDSSSVGQNAAQRWSGGGDNSRIIGVQRGDSKAISQFNSDNDQAWSEQQARGINAFIPADQWDAKAWDKQNSGSMASAPQPIAGDVNMPGLFDLRTFNGRDAYARATGMTGNDYLRKFGTINARPQTQQNNGGSIMKGGSLMRDGSIMRDGSLMKD